MAQVTMTGVSKTYGKTVALDRFTVTVEDGEFVTFLGPSGCGKTTSLRLIAGFIAPTAGSIRIGDQTVSDAAARVHVAPESRDLGMVFQSYAVWPHMDVFRNVAYPLKIRKLSRREAERRVDEVLELVKMPELKRRYPHELSGGQQQRVALARALVMEPRVLLLDEPFSNLDAKLREQMRLELKELQRETGITIVFVTHDQYEAMVLSDRIVVMNQGVIQQIGTPREIYREPDSQFIADFIGTANFLRVVARENGVFLPGGEPQPLALSPPPAGMSGELKLMVRPENAGLSREGGMIRGRVTQKMFVGDAVLYLIDLLGQNLEVKAPADQEYAVGEEVYVRVEGEHYYA